MTRTPHSSQREALAAAPTTRSFGAARLLVSLALALVGVAFALAGPVRPAAASVAGHVTNCNASGAGSLRDAVANASAGATIVFDQDCTGSSKIVLSTPSSAIQINTTLTIDGSGHNVVLSGSGVTTILENNSTLTVSHLRLEAGASVGAIRNNLGSTVTVQKSTIANSSSFFGGGVFSDIGGTITVKDSTFIGNQAFVSCCGGGTGGAIYNYKGSLTVENSTFTGNSAPSGGAIYNDGAGASAIVANSTISGNSATSGGGIVNNGGTVSVENTIVSGNSPDNCSGTIGDLGYNLEHGATSCGFSLHAVTGDPLLGGPASNGGNTQTMALALGSAAIGAADPAACQAAGIGNLDQRGKPRHADQRGVCDIGAFDTGAGALSAAKTTIDRTSSKIAVGGSTSIITVTARDANGNRLWTGGSTVVLQTTLGSISSPATDNGNGTYTATLTSGTVAGTALVTGTIDTNTIGFPRGVAFQAGPPAASTTTIARSIRSIPAGGASFAVITVRAFDQYGNPIKVGGATVLLNTSAGSLSPTVTDLGNGKYTATLTSAISPALATISGTINGDPITATVTVRFT